jgi:hypothetical protein
MGAAVFSLGSVPVMTSCNSRGRRRCFLWGPFTGYIARAFMGQLQLVSELISGHEPQMGLDTMMD